MAKRQSNIDKIEKFWTLVAVGSESECWPFRGVITKLGYGEVTMTVFGRDNWRAHRLSHYLATGEIPPVVMHVCDNPACVNPGHLRGGTQRENNLDCRLKGRHANASGPTAREAGKCFHGHEMTEANTYRRQGRVDECRRCMSVYRQRYRSRPLDQRSPRDSPPATAKLDAEKVVAIRKLIKEGHTGRSVAARFGISPAAVCCVARRNSWKWVEDAQ